MNTPNNLEWLEEQLNDCVVQWKFGGLGKAKQTIATKLSEAYEQGYIDGMFNGQ